MYKLKSLSFRTDNSPEGIARIAEVWQDILSGKLPVEFDGSTGTFPIAKYDNYESDKTGSYDYTLTAVVPDFIVQKEKEVRDGLYRKYEVRNQKGNIVRCTQEAWKQVWDDCKNETIRRKFTADYEIMVYKHFATRIGNLLQIANVLEVDVKELLHSSLDGNIQMVRLVK